MKTFLLFIESYTAGGSDYVAKLLINNLNVNKVIVMVNRGADRKILFSEALPSNVEICTYNLFTPTELSNFANHFSEHKVAFFLLRLLELALRYPLMLISFGYFFFKLRKKQITHFFAHNGGYPGGSFCATASFAASTLKGVRCFFAYHSMPVPRGKWTRFFDGILDAVLDERCTMISVSERSAQALQELRGFQQMPVCIYNGLSESEMKGYRRRDTLKLLHIGYFDSNKNQIMLLHVLKSLIDKGYGDVELTFVGAVSEESAYKKVVRFVDQHNLHQYVKFEGFRKDVSSYYYDNDVLLLCSKTEGFPMVVLEAMRVGMPVVATKVGGIGEQVVHDVNGFLVEPEGETAMAMRLIDFMHHPEMIADMGREARDLFQRKFTLSKMIDKYEQVLDL